MAGCRHRHRLALPPNTHRNKSLNSSSLATRSGDSRWISNDWSREYAHQLRRQVDAVMVGINTVLKDDPQLTARSGTGDHQPLKVIVDSRGRTPLRAKVLQPPGKTLIATTTSIGLTEANQYSNAGIELVSQKSKDDRVDLRYLLQTLGKKEITSVLVEGGGTLLGSLFDLRVVDKVMVFIAPIIIGGNEAPTPVGGNGVMSIAHALRLKHIRTERFGDDIMISGYPEG